MKAFSQLPAAGITAVLLLKAAAFAFGFKLLLIAAAVRLVWTLLRKKPVVRNLRRGIERLLRLACSAI